MSETLLGEIKLFAGNFEPPGWALCDGRLMAISDHPALFELIGTTYGGDGRTTFGLPDMRGRVPVGKGAGPGLTNRKLGEEGGTANIKSGGAERKADSTISTDSSTPIPNAQPLLTVNFIIAIAGKSLRDELRVLRGISD